MARTLQMVASKLALDKDVNEFREFCIAWHAGTLEADNSVVNRVERQAKIVAYKHGCRDQAEDYKQAFLPGLANGSFDGRCSLDWYIRTGLDRLCYKTRQRSRENLRDEMPDDFPDEMSPSIRKICGYIFTDRVIEELVSERPELQRIIVSIVLAHEQCPSRRAIAEEASKTMGTTVTRYQVETALAQIREFVIRCAERHK